MAQFGDPCMQGSDCASGGLCLGSRTGAFTPFCTRFCTDDCSCGRGYTCGAQISSGQRVCIPGNNTCGVTPIDGGTPPPPPPPPTEDVPPATQDVPVPTEDAGVPATDAPPATADNGDSFDVGSGAGSGCGCHTPGTPSNAPASALVAALVALFTARRRNRRP